MKKISQAGIDLIKSYEGLRLKAYKPVETEQYYTIGYGHYGADVSKYMTISQLEAEALLVIDISRFEGYVNNPFYCPVTDELNQNQFDALVSFTYNCGQGALKDLCLSNSIMQIAALIPLYNKSGGKVLPGLQRRRQEEFELFLRPMPPLEPSVADFFLKVMSHYWKLMDGNKAIQDYAHYCNNQLRKVMGIK